jgi:hypothetical protein
MKSKLQKRNIQQHFVTAAYLAGFTPVGDRQSQLYVYERNCAKMFRAVPDKAAKRRNYYSIPKTDGDFDDRVDQMLTSLEAQALPSLRKVVAKDYTLSLFERALLAYLIAFQEFRTPWARANFQHIELSLAEHVFNFSAKVPGYMERTLKELQEKGDVDGSVTAQQIRDSFNDERIKLVARPHAGIDLMVSMGQKIGNIYTQMQWTVIRAKEGQFLTSDAPLCRRDPGYKGGLYGGGLMSRTAEVWFPLSKGACLAMRHDAQKMEQFGKLLDAGKTEEAAALQAELSPIGEFEVEARHVEAINGQTILNADRFVYSPFESEEIPKLFKGESQNLRFEISPPRRTSKKRPVRE